MQTPVLMALLCCPDDAAEMCLQSGSSNGAAIMVGTAGVVRRWLQQHPTGELLVKTHAVAVLPVPTRMNPHVAGALQAAGLIQQTHTDS